MVVILDERYTLFATSKPSSPVGFYGWENWLRLQRKISPLSMFVFHGVMCHISSHIYRERREHRVFQELLKSVAGLEECLMQGEDEEVDVVAELASTISFSYVFKVNCVSHQLTKGASGARGDDTKSLKGSVLDWITPKGQNLVPPLARNVKIDRGFHHERTGALLCPAGLDWSHSEWVVSYLFTWHAS